MIGPAPRQPRWAAPGIRRLATNRRQAVLLAGALAAALALVAGMASGGRPAARPTPVIGSAADPATASAATPFAGWALLESGGSFSAAEVAAVAATTGRRPLPVAVDELYVAAQSGPYALPVSTLVVEAGRYATASGEASLTSPLRTGLVLAASAAALLGVVTADVLRPTEGRELRVSAVVADVLLGGRQAAVDTSFAAVKGLRLTVDADYLLLPAEAADLAGVSAAVVAVLPARRLRLRAPQPNGTLVSSGRVLSQTQVQQRFGMLPVRRVAAGLVVDPAWEATYIVRRRVPLLGAVTCNRLVLPALVEAMKALQRQGLADLVETADFADQGGCWNPRTVRGRTALSRHAWGIAVDINVAHNPLGDPPRQDARLVAAMAQAGFTWGGRFLRPDGAHFEWVGTAARP